MSGRLVVVRVLPLLVVVSCGLGGTASEGGERPGDALGVELSVLGAASLTDAVEEVARAFEEDHEGLDVELSFDGSSRLASAILEGVPADVFASADEASLQRVVEEGGTDGTGLVFATNALQIVVAEGNPRRLGGLEDLGRSGTVLALCDAETPCGAYAAQAFARAGLLVPPAGREDNVRGVLTKVALGEADAGLVYATDVLAAKGVDGVDLAAHEQVRATYLAAALADAPNREAATAFVAFLTSPEAQAILRSHGFGPP